MRESKLPKTKDADEPEGRSKTFGVVYGLLAGGLGAATGFLAVKIFGKHDGVGWSELMAVAIALGLLVLGVVQLVASRTSKRIRSYSGRVLPAMQRQFVLQGLVLILAAVMLAMPVLVPHLVQGVFHGALAYGSLLVLFVVQTWLNIRIWRTADEFYRRALIETSAVSFWVLQGALFLWAAAEQFGVAPALSAWDCVTVLMTVYLVLSGIVARRLGLEG